MKAIRYHININPADVIYINGVLDSYEGLAIMRTEDEKSGKIVVYSAAANERYLAEVLNALKDEGVRLEIVSIDNEDKVDC